VTLRWTAAALGLVGILALARPAGAAEPDSVGAYLRSLADSTDRYFGAAAAPVDTAGLDSALAYGLLHPPKPKAHSWMPSIGPWFSFDRADGALWGGSLGLGEPEHATGTLSGRWGYAAGPNDDRWAVHYRKEWHHEETSGRTRRASPRWSLDLQGGELRNTLDPDHPAHFFPTARALLNGSDYNHYFLREGVSAGLERATSVFRIGGSYRNQVEHPLATTTTWDLFRRPLTVVFNQPAANGRVGAVEGEMGVRWPRWGLQAEGEVGSAAGSLGSDFDFTRWRVALGAERPLGSIASLVPQLEYGRLTGDPTPQASFYLGGSHSLRSIQSVTLGGTTKALGRLDLFIPHDLLRLAHIPHPAFLPLEAAGFAGIGAVSGTDPYGGPARPGSSWPDQGTWHSEAGVGLLWRPGIPDPLHSIRLDCAWRLGADSGRHLSMSYTRPLDLFKPFE
jgi:hypothetical protein